MLPTSLTQRRIFIAMGKRLFRDLHCVLALLRFQGQCDTKVGKIIGHVSFQYLLCS